MKIIIYFKSFLMLAALFLMPFIAHAQANMSTSSAQDIAFSFYKASGTTPNFERWVKVEEPYLSTPMSKRDEVIVRQVDILRTQFDAYNPTDELLTIKTKVRARIQAPTDPENPSGRFEYEYVRAPGDEPKMFLYDYADDHFALTAENIDEYRQFEIPAKQIDYYRKEIKRNVNGELTAVLQLLPSTADTKEPYDIKGQDYWLFTSKIAAITFWNNRGRLIYQYSAPWYFSPVNQELKDLKGEQIKQDELMDQGVDWIKDTDQ